MRNCFRSSPDTVVTLQTIAFYVPTTSSYLRLLPTTPANRGILLEPRHFGNVRQLAGPDMDSNTFDKNHALVLNFTRWDENEHHVQTYCKRREREGPNVHLAPRLLPHRHRGRNFLTETDIEFSKARDCQPIAGFLFNDHPPQPAENERKDNEQNIQTGADTVRSRSPLRGAGAAVSRRANDRTRKAQG